MRLLRSLIVSEWRLQGRSLRFRFTAATYLVICGLPPALIFFVVRDWSEESLGASTYLAETLVIQPFLTVIAAALVAGNRSGQRALAESWSPLAAATLSHLGYLVRRYLALATLLVPLTAIPQGVAAGFALAAGTPILRPETWVWSWLLLIVPLALTTAAIWLAAVTIVGNELAAAVACLAIGGLGRTGLNQILFAFRLTFDGASDWLGFGRLEQWLSWTRWWFSREGRREHPGWLATEAPFDLTAALEWLVPRAALPSALAVLALVVSAAFLRRTRRDLKPRRVRQDHPVRTYLELWNRFRQRYAPDAALSLGERLGLVAAGLVVVAVLGAMIDRQMEFRALAEARYQALTEAVESPTAIDVRPLAWSIEGRLTADGRIDVEVRGRLHHRGHETEEALAFTANAGLHLIAATSPTHRLTIQRSWDRLALRLEPPLEPGEEIELEFRLAGIPSQPAFGLRRRGVSFVRGFQAFTTARFPRELLDFSRARVQPAINDRRIVLDAGDLGPVPRYTTWALTPPSTTPGVPGQTVPDELWHPLTELSVDLTMPPEWFLADSCGHASQMQNGFARLQGQCRTSPGEFAVRGGEFESFRDEEGTGGRGPVVAALATHQEVARELLPSLGRTVALSERAWPGLEPVRQLVVMEWPPIFDVDLQSETKGFRDPPQQVLMNRLVLIPERRFVGSEPLAAEYLVAGSLTRSLLERRELDADEDHVLRAIFEALMIRRMGLGSEAGATASAASWEGYQLQMPILNTHPTGYDIALRQRLPALMVDVESRVGAQALHDGIQSFLSRNGEPGTVRELLTDLEEHSGVSLQRVYEDFFDGIGIPELRLEEVRSRRDGDRWRVEGAVRNTGVGQVICPVVIEAGSDQIQDMVTVDTKSATEFSVLTTTRPHAVLLDPRRTCHRRVTRASPTLERAYLEN